MLIAERLLFLASYFRNVTKMKAEKEIVEKAQVWLDSPIDEESKAAVRQMLESEDQSELIDAFYKDMDFGTGGMRGIMGVGSNRLNIYTLGMATQGLSNYLLKSFPNQRVKVAISYDSRNNSQYFARKVADVFTANGIEVYFSDKVRPTPMVSYAIRHFECQSGVMLTASHNPKEYNGFKAYWEDGAQVIAPHDKNIIAEVNKISSIAEIKFDGNPDLIHIMEDSFDRSYLAEIMNLKENPDLVSRHSGLSIVYSPIHGTTGEIIPKALKSYGFENVHVVEEQRLPDGDFPTVISPNPEEAEAMDLAIKLAEKVSAHIVLASDPDGDRVGVAAIGKSGKYELLNGNQTAAILTWYLLRNLYDNRKLKGNEFIVKTIVTSDLVEKIATFFGVKCYQTLTGFKYIAQLIREKEGSEKFIGGGEESYGYMVGDFVRDKDAVSACVLLGEIGAWTKARDLTLFDLLDQLHLRNGFYKEQLISITKKGKSGAEEIQAIMQKLRENMPDQILSKKVVRVVDVKAGTDKDLIANTTTLLTLESSNVLQFYLEDGSKISARPSGTEPKIKFYISVNMPFLSQADYAEVNGKLMNRIEQLKGFLENFS